MADSGERIRVLMTENSQILASGEGEEQANDVSGTATDVPNGSGIESFATELSNALEEAAVAVARSSCSEASVSASDSSDTDSDNQTGPSTETVQGLKNSEYVSPLEDPYEKAWKYLSKHNVLQLFQGITTDIAYKRPGDPIDYMIDEIEKLQEQDRRRKGVVKLTLPVSKPASAKQPHGHDGEKDCLDPQAAPQNS